MNIKRKHNFRFKPIKDNDILRFYEMVKEHGYVFSTFISYAINTAYRYNDSTIVAKVIPDKAINQGKAHCIYLSKYDLELLEEISERTQTKISALIRMALKKIIAVSDDGTEYLMEEDKVGMLSTEIKLNSTTVPHKASMTPINIKTAENKAKTNVIVGLPANSNNSNNKAPDETLKEQSNDKSNISEPSSSERTAKNNISAISPEEESNERLFDSLVKW